MKAKVLPLILLFAYAPLFAHAQISLWLVEKRIDIKYSVANITHEELSEKLDSKEAAQYVLFDVREKEEYAVSHLASALQLDPGTSAEAFLKTFGPMIRGKNLVFYCSVGDRSSRMIERIRARALQAGALSVLNLRGGIFRWYNENHPVVNKEGVTDAIHPYDEEWGKLIEKRN